jgi:hypothetical protein
VRRICRLVTHPAFTGNSDIGQENGRLKAPSYCSSTQSTRFGCVFIDEWWRAVRWDAPRRGAVSWSSLCGAGRRSSALLLVHRDRQGRLPLSDHESRRRKNSVRVGQRRARPEEKPSQAPSPWCYLSAETALAIAVHVPSLRILEDSHRKCVSTF